MPILSTSSTSRTNRFVAIPWANCMDAAWFAARDSAKAWLNDAVLKDCPFDGRTVYINRGCLKRGSMRQTFPLEFDAHIKWAIMDAGGPEWLAQGLGKGLLQAWRNWFENFEGQVTNVKAATLFPPPAGETVIMGAILRVEYGKVVHGPDFSRPLSDFANNHERVLATPALLAAFLRPFLRGAVDYEALMSFSTRFASAYQDWRFWAYVCNIWGEGVKVATANPLVCTVSGRGGSESVFIDPLLGRIGRFEEGYY